MHNRFFVSPEAILNNNFSITDSGLVHQLTRVLRVKNGDELELLDGSEKIYHSRINEISKREISGTIIKTEFRPDSPKRFVTLYQSLIKKDNFELVLQKGTELGVSVFVPIIAARSVKIKDEIPPRWHEIVREAAEQCGRTKIPEIKSITKFKDAIKSFSGGGFLAHEEERLLSLKDALGSNKTVSIFIGPEGGFSSEETELAKSQNIEIVSLGKNVLRSETAGIAAATLALL